MKSLIFPTFGEVNPWNPGRGSGGSCWFLLPLPPPAFFYFFHFSLWKFSLKKAPKTRWFHPEKCPVRAIRDTAPEFCLFPSGIVLLELGKTNHIKFLSSPPPPPGAFFCLCLDLRDLKKKKSLFFNTNSFLKWSKPSGSRRHSGLCGAEFP